MRGRVVNGALAGAAALAVTWAASAISTSVPFPPYSLADRLVRLTPGSVATFFIDRLQHNALRLLAVVGTLALVAAGAAFVRASSRLRRASAPVVACAFGALVATIELGDPVPRSRGGIALSAALAAGAFLFAQIMLELPAGPGERDRPQGERFITRRKAIQLVGGSLVGVALGGTLLGRLIGGGRTLRVSLAGLRPERRRRPPFPGVRGLSPEVTSVGDHYVVDIDISDPIVDAGSWRLRVFGLVDRPLSLGFDELQSRFRLAQEYAVLSCISNQVGGPLVGNSLWQGVRLRDLLAAVGPRANASEVVFRCVDGYSVGIPLGIAKDESALVAIAQNGEALAREHGFPCRIRIPALYGMMNAKWVESIELVDRPYSGYWQQQGWSESGVVRTESRIDTREPVRAGMPTWIAGVAWAGVRGISAVEVSTDGGRSWARAVLHEPLSRVAWTQWAYRWTPPRPAKYTVVCRATDGNGATQDAIRRPPHPSGASGYHSVELTAS
jgi:DMSO/TMAO reductase YedYZ molybdopterin-dependent catalytic subunit